MKRVVVYTLVNVQLPGGYVLRTSTKVRAFALVPFEASR